LRLRIERFRFSLIKRNIRQYGGQAPQKNFLFLKEKIAREKIKKCRENFSVLVCRSGAEASGNAPHSCSVFSLKKVRISFRIRSITSNSGPKALFLFVFTGDSCGSKISAGNSVKLASFELLVALTTIYHFC